MPSSMPLVALFYSLCLVVLDSSGISCFLCSAHLPPQLLGGPAIVFRDFISTRLADSNFPWVGLPDKI